MGDCDLSKGIKIFFERLFKWMGRHLWLKAMENYKDSLRELLVHNDAYCFPLTGAHRRDGPQGLQMLVGRLGLGGALCHPS